MYNKDMLTVDANGGYKSYQKKLFLSNLSVRGYFPNTQISYKTNRVPSGFKKNDSLESLACLLESLLVTTSP